MSESVKMPALGESVTEGTVSSWLKAVGDTVEVDEPLLEVATDKVDTEVPSPAAGVVLEIRVAEDETVEVGTVLAIIGDPSEATASPEPAQPAPQAAPEPQTPAAPAAPEAPATTEAPAAPPAAGGQGVEVAMPALGESVTEGTVSSWLKAVGDTVEVDEPLLEVATDKVDTEVPSPAAGVVLEIRVAEDETVEVGTVLAIIGDPSEATASPEPAQPAPQAAPEPQTPAAPAAPEAPATTEAPAA
ncbi:2-oxoglutarate dehydrogenase, E2 component, dihydrolipoamide succinyltransferase, partial [Actinomyces bowdenii]|uniref:biotin/lipoyl-containing protein n=1 Tax=Actinomyces bowdenii TaxID=131109 RepID=UPI001B25C47C|nr:2-oxoglutarate dehydrogenase, E2 component, dihydrolipoamide succinyltransferase [Actinomyces bowdenii]